MTVLQWDITLKRGTGHADFFDIRDHRGVLLDLSDWEFYAYARTNSMSPNTVLEHRLTIIPHPETEQPNCAVEVAITDVMLLTVEPGIYQQSLVATAPGSEWRKEIFCGTLTVLEGYIR